ncbi:hypothetical protein An02g09033 [Aspergillus niger]|uniref:Transmembrane protein n=2 Tax=Aspergillus niger TaxID=5061 RepID=A2QE18_ASPNC|nr:hypothetical protein An02g09033 [Aspergillus niger]CAK44314.1 hypothetical protein An02g09033 [Aspergillus niger]
MPAGADDRLKVSRFIHLHCSPADWPDRASSCHEFPNQAKAGRSRTPVESRSPRVLAVSLCVWPLGQFPRRHDPFFCLFFSYSLVFLPSFNLALFSTVPSSSFTIYLFSSSHFSHLLIFNLPLLPFSNLPCHLSSFSSYYFPLFLLHSSFSVSPVSLLTLPDRPFCFPSSNQRLFVSPSLPFCHHCHASQLFMCCLCW